MAATTTRQTTGLKTPAMIGSTPPPQPRHQSDARFEVGPGEAATSKQIVALQNIAKSNKTDPDLADEINRKLKTPPKDGEVCVTKKEASDLISRAFDKD